MYVNHLANAEKTKKKRIVLAMINVLIEWRTFTLRLSSF